MAVTAASEADPALMAWQAWRAAHARTLAHCHAQQRLEGVLRNSVGFSVGVEDQAASSPAWTQADALVGYSRALLAEAKAADVEEEIAEALWATPATSLAGVAAKLDAMLRHGEWCEDCDEFPWPQLRGVLGDVARLGGLEDWQIDGAAS